MEDELGFLSEEGYDDSYGNYEPQPQPQQRGRQPNQGRPNINQQQQQQYARQQQAQYAQPRPGPAAGRQQPSVRGRQPMPSPLIAGRGGRGGKRPLPQQTQTPLLTPQQLQLQNQQMQIQLQQQQIQQQMALIKQQQDGLLTSPIPRPGAFAKGGPVAGGSALDLQMAAGKNLVEAVNTSQLGNVGTSQQAPPQRPVTASGELEALKKTILELQDKLVAVSAVANDAKSKATWFWGVVQAATTELYEKLPSTTDKVFQVKTIPAGTWLKIYYPLETSVDYQGVKFVWGRTDSIDVSTAFMQTYWVKLVDLTAGKNIVGNFHFRSLEEFEDADDVHQ